MDKMAESVVEEATLEWFEGLGFTVAHGPDLAPDGPSRERGSYADVVLLGRLRAALGHLNPTLPPEAIEEATAIDQEQAAAVMLEKYEIVAAMLHGFDYSAFFTGTQGERLSVIPQAMEHVLAQDDGRERYLKAVSELSKAFALAVPHPEAIRIRDDVGFSPKRQP